MTYRKRYMANPDFVARDIAGDVVLVPVGDSAQSFNGMVLLNATGQFIWEYIQEARTMEEVTQAVTDEFEVTDEEAAGDVRAFILTGVVNHLILEKLD